MLARLLALMDGWIDSTSCGDSALRRERREVEINEQLLLIIMTDSGSVILLLFCELFDII